MPGPKAAQIEVSETIKQILQQWSSSRMLPKAQIERSQILMLAIAGESNAHIARILGFKKQTVRKWRGRLADAQASLKEAVLEGETPRQLRTRLEVILRDQSRPGTPGKFTAEQICQIIAVACEKPRDSGWHSEKWTIDMVHKEVLKRGIAEISRARIGFFLKSGGSQASS